MQYENTMLTVRLTSKDYENIDALVEKGFAMNKSDFIRMATREKIARCSSEA